MSTTYDPTSVEAVAVTPSAEPPVSPPTLVSDSYGRTSGRPGPGLILGALLLAIGGPVFAGILQAVAGGG